MKQTYIGFYVVKRMTCALNIPDDVSPQEARDAIVGVRNEVPMTMTQFMVHLPPQYVLDAIRAMNAEAASVNGVCDWSDEDGIWIEED